LIFDFENQRKAEKFTYELFGCFRASHDNYARHRLLPTPQRAGELALNKPGRQAQIFEDCLTGTQRVMNVNAPFVI
jgi:hypothetical protein